jgi:hypothetical protein
MSYEAYYYVTFATSGLITGAFVCRNDALFFPYGASAKAIAKAVGKSVIILSATSIEYTQFMEYLNAGGREITWLK